MVKSRRIGGPVTLGLSANLHQSDLMMGIATAEKGVLAAGTFDLSHVQIPREEANRPVKIEDLQADVPYLHPVWAIR